MRVRVLACVCVCVYVLGVSVLCVAARACVYICLLSPSARVVIFPEQLVELLEIPHLMDTCVRNSLFDEALDLSDFLSSVVRKHKLAEPDAHTVPRNSILIDVVVEARDTLRFMRDIILTQLRGKVCGHACPFVHVSAPDATAPYE